MSDGQDSGDGIKRVQIPTPHVDRPDLGAADATEAERRRLLPIVNRPAHEALAAAGATIAAEWTDVATELTPEQVEVLNRRRDDEAMRILRERHVAEFGADNVFDADQLGEHFTVMGFAAPFVVVVRKSDGVKGSLEFTHHPRLYFNFQAD
jgi:hypothetical protein